MLMFSVFAPACPTLGLNVWFLPYYVDPMNIDLGPVYMEKSCSGQEGHPPSRVNFTERLYEEKVDPSARAKS